MAAADVEIRRARVEDYQDVMDIDPDLYDGTDYLPSKYHQYIRDPNRLPYVFIYRGKIIGFRMLYVVDNGERFVGQAARIHKDYRSMGIMSTTAPFFEKEVRRHFPRVKRLWATTISWHLYPKSSIWQLLGYRIAMLLSIPQKIKIPREMEDSVRASETIGRLHHLSKVETMSLCMDASIKWRLFPSSYVIIALEPFSLIPENFDIIFDNCTAIYGNYSHGTGQIRSVSFGNVFHTKVGLIYRLDFYGENDEDVIQHFLAHYKNAVQRYMNGRLSFNIYLAPSMGAENIIAMLKLIPNVSSYIPGIDMRKLYLVTRTLNSDAKL